MTHPDAAYDALPCPWLRLGGSGRVEAANRALLALLRADAGTVIGSAFDDWLTGAARVVFQSLVQPMLKLYGHVGELALTLQPRGADAVDVLFYATPSGGGADGMAAAFSVQLATIAQRRRIEVELLRVKRAADQAPGMLFQLERLGDGHWRFPYVSEAVRRLYGSSPDAAARSADAVWHGLLPADRDTLLQALTTAAQTGQPFRELVRVAAPADGPPRWHEFQGMARTRAGGTTLWHGHVADVTDRVAMQDAVVQREAMERVAQARSAFIARVSHELRTPLNGILGFAQLLASDRRQPLAPDQARGVGVILDAGRHLLAIVNELLEISRIESGQLSLVLEPVDPWPLVGQVLQVLAAGAAERGLRLQASPPARRRLAQAEPQRLRQVLLNLVSNAIKYNRPHVGEVQVSLADDGDGLRIDVRDTGPGLTDAEQAELFQPFNRLGAPARGVEGTGLGLVICRHLVDLMGGQLRVHSVPGEGSTFSVWLPALPEATDPVARPAPAEVTSAHDDAHPASGRVLYVEDNPVNAVLMEDLLSRRPGVALEVAPDGARALALAARGPWSLLLLDRHLPDIEGAELLRRLRRLPGMAGVPAVMVSATAGAEAEAQAIDAGFDGYWTKPLDLDTTLAEIDRWLVVRPPEPRRALHG